LIVGFPQSDVEDKTDGISILAAVADQLIRTLAITALRGLISGSGSSA
jgi:hypothetical protein